MVRLTPLPGKLKRKPGPRSGSHRGGKRGSGQRGGRLGNFSQGPIGKVPDARILPERFFDTLKHYAWDGLPITLEHARLAGAMPGAHGDPFDRMLIAQAITQSLAIISNDKAFDAYPVERQWL